MASYLERYQRGECSEVWTEIALLSKTNSPESAYVDAIAVAEETMRRARRNLEILIPRLVSIGYRFGYDWIQPTSSGHLTPDARLSYFEAVDWARSQYPVFVPATAREELLTTLDKPRQRLLAIGADVLISRLDELQQSVASRPTMQHRLDVIEQVVGRLPLSIRAWYTIVGSVNLVGYSDAWLKSLPDDPDGVCPMYQLDPLVISPLEASIQAYPSSDALLQEKAGPEHALLPTWSRFNQYDPAAVEPQWLNWKSNASGVKYRLVLAKSPRGKYNAGPDDIGLEAELPQSGVDLTFVSASPPTGLTFVNYLRTCFRWGGFPGWEQCQTRPNTDLTYLTDGLEAI